MSYEKTIYPKSYKDLAAILRSDQQPFFFSSSRTSTVIPYGVLERYPELRSLTEVNLSQMEKRMQINPDDLSVTIEGAVTWQESRHFVRSHGFDLMTSPTEELAMVLAGLATSCTGERAFAFGNLRKQVLSVDCCLPNGELLTLSAEKPFKEMLPVTLHPLLDQYQQAQEIYQNFKNPPWPSFSRETDLVIGTEGQLAVVLKARLKIIPAKNLDFFMVRLPYWKESCQAHLKIHEWSQKWRGPVYSVEFLDQACMEYVADDFHLEARGDCLFFEIEQDATTGWLEEIQELFPELVEDVFQLSGEKYHRLRAAVPPAIFEANQKMQVEKMGTDIQVAPHQFALLLNEYQRAAEKLQIPHYLFGHFGDSHLHFNFLPSADQRPRCLDYFDDLYTWVALIQASPFAEHGVGILKQKYMKNFFRPETYELFTALKHLYDPFYKFFPLGFMRQKL